MSSTIRHMKRLLKSKDAVTADEYAILLALIVIVAAVAITLLGDKVRSFFGTIAEAIGMVV